MDWEGGTIGAIVPALMGHGEGEGFTMALLFWSPTVFRQRLWCIGFWLSTEKPPGHYTTGGCQSFTGLQAGL